MRGSTAQQLTAGTHHPPPGVKVPMPPHLLQASYCLQMRSHGQEGNSHLPKDCEFDKFCSIQDPSQGADFQVPRGFEYHPRGHAIDDHAARVECDFSVRNFHGEIHANGFPCDETTAKN